MTIDEPRVVALEPRARDDPRAAGAGFREVDRVHPLLASELRPESGGAAFGVVLARGLTDPRAQGGAAVDPEVSGRLALGQSSLDLLPSTIRTLEAYGSLLGDGSLQCYGAFNRVSGSLLFAGPLASRGSLPTSGYLATDGSLASDGSLSGEGSLASIGSLIPRGSLAGCGSLPTLGSLIPDGSLQ